MMGWDEERQAKPRHARAQSAHASSSQDPLEPRPSSAQLQRFYSPQHLDDQSIYHNHKDHNKEDDTSSSTLGKETPGDEDIEKDADSAREEGRSQIEEVIGGIPAEIDVEAQRPPLEKKPTSKSGKDPNLVTWDGPDDPANPKNWTFKKKWAATLVVSSFTFISPVSSSMVAPALGAISAEFGITSDVESQLTLSIFILAYAIGPLFLGPCSEIYGRVPVLQLANLVYLVFNIACGVCTSKGQMLAFRFLSGLGGSAPLALGGGVLSDCWSAEQRGRAISLYSLAPLLGPAVGPLAGGFITENTTWRWAFYATSIADAVIQISGLLFLKETYPQKLLQNKAERLRKETGNMELKTEYDHPERSLGNTLRRSLLRPFRLLGNTGDCSSACAIHGISLRAHVPCPLHLSNVMERFVS